MAYDGTKPADGSSLVSAEIRANFQALNLNVIKAWISFDCTGTIAINDSYNVTSITDNGVGDYTITWDTDFANANYSYATCGEDSDGTGDVVIARPNGGTKTGGQLQIKSVTVAPLGFDPPEIALIAIGDQ